MPLVLDNSLKMFKLDEFLKSSKAGETVTNIIKTKMSKKNSEKTSFLF